MTVTLIHPTRFKQCGFCETGHHDKCVVGVRNAKPKARYPDDSIYPCECEEGGCQPGRVKCTDCHNVVQEEVDPDTWKCLDREACATSLETRRAANPLLASLRKAKESAKMAKIENAEKTKAAKTPKVGKCLVTGKETKGGLFLPGMDARYASERVKDVMEGRATKAVALKKMKDDGTSPALQAKFEKNLGIAQDKDAKRKAAEKEKAEAKKAAAKDKAAK